MLKQKEKPTTAITVHDTIPSMLELSPAVKEAAKKENALAQLYDDPIVQEKAVVGKLLAQAFKYVPPEFISHRKGASGKWLSYLAGELIPRVLNDQFGLNWSFHVKEKRNEGDIYFAFGSLTIIDVTREDCGSHKLKFDGDIEHAYKGAITDSMKRCSRQFGIASDLYAPDGAGINATYKDLLIYLIHKHFGELHGTTQFVNDTEDELVAAVDKLSTILEARDHIKQIFNTLEDAKKKEKK